MQFNLSIFAIYYTCSTCIHFRHLDALSMLLFTSVTPLSTVAGSATHFHLKPLTTRCEIVSHHPLNTFNFFD